jgi:hypothetical protein
VARHPVALLPVLPSLPAAAGLLAPALTPVAVLAAQEVALHLVDLVAALPLATEKLQTPTLLPLAPLAAREPAVHLAAAALLAAAVLSAAAPQAPAARAAAELPVEVLPVEVPPLARDLSVVDLPMQEEHEKASLAAGNLAA